MEKHTIGEVVILLEQLTIKVDKGFEDVTKRQDKTNGNVIANTEFRLKSTGSIATIKWIVGLLGITNLITLLKLFV